MQSLIKFLPYIFLAYYAVRFFKEPLFLLGIPFLMYFRYCILFDTVRLFWVFGRLGQDVLLLLWLLVTWLVISTKVTIFTKKDKFVQEKNYEKRLNWLDYIVLGLIVLTSVNLFLVLHQYYILEDVFKQYFMLIALFVGYFVIKITVNFSKVEVLKNFLFSIVVVNTVASLLYIMHQGLHFTIFAGEEYSEDFFQGAVITRTFWFMPILWFFSIPYLLVFKKGKSPVNLALLSVNLLGVFISYTRSYMIIAVLVIFLFYFLEGIKRRAYGAIVKNLFMMGIGGVLFFFVVSSFLPASTNYFLGRFSEINSKAKDEESNTLIYRFARTGEVIDKIGSDKAMIGFGPVTSIQLPWLETMEAATSDLVWTGVVFRWGYIGMILFVSLYVVSMIKAYYLFMRSEGFVAQFALMLLLYIFSQLIEGFTSWTFLAPNRLAFGLWYFGLLSALVSYHKHSEEHEEEEDTEEVENQEAHLHLLTN